METEGISHREARARLRTPGPVMRAVSLIRVVASQRVVDVAPDPATAETWG